MKLQVINSTKKSSEIKVLCKSKYGEVTLIWADECPVNSQTYDVELDTKQILYWGKNITCSQEHVTICNSNGKNTLVGDLESLDEDGYLVIRINDSIFTFMSEGVIFQQGMRVKVEIEPMTAYPVEY